MKVMEIKIQTIKAQRTVWNGRRENGRLVFRMKSNPNVRVVREAGEKTFTAYDYKLETNGHPTINKACNWCEQHLYHNEG